MRIIVNSDVLYSSIPAVNRLPKYLENLFLEAAAVGAVIVIPRTSLLEYEHRQATLDRSEGSELESAAGRLRAYGIVIPESLLQALAVSTSLPDLLRAVGAKVEIEDPFLEDYRNAELRACNHLPPCPPKSKSDEMRDLVIWEVALRIARQDGQALLFSRDDVHSGELGADEAAAANLYRAKNSDEVLEFLGKESPVGQSARRLLATVWSELRKQGLPLATEINIKSVSEASFSTDSSGRLGGSFYFDAHGEGGIVSANISILQQHADNIAVGLTNVRYRGGPWNDGTLSLLTPGILPVVAPSAEEAIAALREVLGDQE